MCLFNLSFRLSILFYIKIIMTKLLLPISNGVYLTLSPRETHNERLIQTRFTIEVRTKIQPPRLYVNRTMPDNSGLFRLEASAAWKGRLLKPSPSMNDRI